jgi:hypothetical protein
MKLFKSALIVALFIAAMTNCGNVVIGNGNCVKGENNVIDHGDGNKVEGSDNFLR